MPVIVVGADTKVGKAIVVALEPGPREIRAFVSDPEAGARYKAIGAKTALGDVSDASHVGSAAIGAFSAILVAEAASDGRERSFATSADAVFETWAEALAEAEVSRTIWVGDVDPPDALAASVPHLASVPVGDRSPAIVAQEVAMLDDRSDWDAK